MFIVSKDGQSIFNVDHAACIYVGEKQGVKLTTSTGAGFRLGFYETEQEAEAALQDLAKNMGNVPVYFMADDATAAMMVEKATGRRPERYHGAKPKRHGGS